MARQVDVVIVGGGIAGITSWLWCRRLGLDSVLLESGERLGGQLYWIHNALADFPGFWGTGAELAERLEAQVAAFRCEPQLRTEVKRLCFLLREEEGPRERKSRKEGENKSPREGEGRREGESRREGKRRKEGEASWQRTGWVWRVESSRGDWEARAVILATGMCRRRLEVPGFSRLLGKGVSFTASGAREQFEGRRVCIVGGGDGAVENALLLAPHCPEVTILCRGSNSRAQAQFLTRLQEFPQIHLSLGSEVQEILGEERVEAVRWKSPTGEHVTKVGAVLVKIGLVPQLSFLEEDQAERFPSGVLRVDPYQRTTAPMLWAVGDICAARDPSLSVSVGHACLAAREIERTLRHNGRVRLPSP